MAIDGQDSAVALFSRVAELEHLLHEKDAGYAAVTKAAQEAHNQIVSLKADLRVANEQFDGQAAVVKDAQLQIIRLKADLLSKHQAADLLAEEKTTALSRVSELEIQLTLQIGENRRLAESAVDVKQLQSQLQEHKELHSQLRQQNENADMAVERSAQQQLESTGLAFEETSRLNSRIAKLELLLDERAQELASQKATAQREALSADRRLEDLRKALHEQKGACEELKSMKDLNTDLRTDLRSMKIDVDSKAEAQIAELQCRLKQQEARLKQHENGTFLEAVRQELANKGTQLRPEGPTKSSEDAGALKRQAEELSTKELQLRREDTRKPPDDVRATETQQNTSLAGDKAPTYTRQEWVACSCGPRSKGEPIDVNRLDRLSRSLLAGPQRPGVPVSKDTSPSPNTANDTHAPESSPEWSDFKIRQLTWRPGQPSSFPAPLNGNDGMSLGRSESSPQHPIRRKSFVSSVSDDSDASPLGTNSQLGQSESELRPALSHVKLLSAPPTSSSSLRVSANPPSFSGIASGKLGASSMEPSWLGGRAAPTPAWVSGRN